MKNKNKEKPKELFEKNNHLRKTDIYDDQSAKTLDKTEIIYQNMLNFMNEGVAFHQLIYDENNRPVDYIVKNVNNQFELILGIKKEQAIGKRATILYKNKEAPYLEIYSKVAESGKPTRFETYFPSMDKYFLISVFSPEKGQFVTIFSDISAQKKVGEDLRREKDFRKSIIQNSPAFFIAINAKGKMLSMNNTMLNTLGYSLKEIMGKDYLSIFVPKEDRVEFSNISQKILKDNVSILNESQVIAKNGQKLLVEWHGSPVLKSNGDVDYFIGIGIDITERKQVEETLRQSQQEFASLFKNNPEALVYVDNKNNILDINNRFSELFGYTLKEIKGKNIKEGIIQPPTRIKEGEELDKIAFAKGYINFETVRKRKDGTLFPVLISGSPIIVDGQLLGRIGTFIDITERKIAKDKLEESFKKLQRTMDTTIDTMSKIIEAKDPYTFGHQRRVSQLAIRIAQELDLPKDKIEGIRITSLIHDVGKIGLPTEILSKPTKLNDLEYSLIKNHSQIGYDIIKSIDFSYPVAQTVLQHHERLNGSGYPTGLKGDEILLEAKIICVADVVEAMSSHRPYRPALGIDKALEEIFKNKSMLYDPEATNACIRLFKEKDFEFEL